MQAFSNYGDIVITNTGNASKYSPGVAAIRAVADDGYAAGIVAYTGADGSINVSNTGGYVIAEGYFGAVGIGANSYSGDITVSNAPSANGYGGVIAATAIYGDASGVDAFSDYGNIGVTNSGYVVAESAYGSAFGINAETGNYSDGTITVTNTGIVAASGDNNTYGINANSDTGAITISNDDNANGLFGVIVAEANDVGYAYGINAEINDSSSTSNITITNGYGGLILATAFYTDETADAYGVKAYHNGDGDIVVTNAGTIRAQSYDDAQAIWAYADGDGDISITNTSTGKLYAESSDDDAYGIYAYADGDGSVTVTNAGDINAQTSGDYGDAYGVYAYTNGDGNVSVTNSQYGSIIASTIGYSSDATGIYAYADGDGNSTVSNSGTVLAQASGDNGDATGVYAYTNGDGDVLLTNTATGTITATTSGDDTEANAAMVQADSNAFGNATLVNAGSLTATATGYSSDAYGVYIESDGDGSITLTNSGSITATTSGNFSDAYGVYAQHEDYGDVVITNTATGSITVTTSGNDSDAYGISAWGSEGNNFTIGNSGDVTVSASGYSSDAKGIYVDANRTGYGDITVTNTLSGYVDVSSAYGSATGIGIYAEMGGNLNDGGDIRVTNAGDILVQGYGSAAGIAVDVDQGSIYVPAQFGYCPSYSTCQDVYGNNIYTGLYGQSFVTVASSSTPGQGGMPVTVTNSGSIDVTSDYSNAEGITVNMGNGSYGELASITNSGSIDVVTEDGFLAWGIHVDNRFGDISVTNTASGTIDVANESAPFFYAGGGYAVGIRTFAEYGDTTISNAGDIIVGNSPWRSNGIRAENKYGDVTVSNLAGGSISVNTGGFDAYGIEVDNKYGDVTVTNAGSITVSGGSWNNKGIEVDNEDGDTVITTAAGSSISVTGTGNDVTGGILGYSETGDITVTNAGSLTVTADNFAVGINAYTDYGDVTVGNSAAVTVTSADSNAVGISAETNLENDYYYGAFSDSHVTVTNSGNITVSGYWTSEGIQVRSEDYGDISVTNTATGRLGVTSSYGTAYGINAYADGAGDIVISNAGAITATGRDGDAFGINAETDNDEYNVVGGAISISTAAGSSITATANGDYGDAYGIYARVEEDDGGITITNAGSITVTANGYDGSAYGIYAEIQDYGDITITNTANITVNANGDFGDAVGIRAEVQDGGDISISNSANIVANAGDFGFSAGIYSINFDGSETTISNTGSIRATGDYAWAIYHYGTDVDISNSSAGKIFGVIATDYGNDSFTNNGKWYATEGVNYLSEFNEGDDNIVNSATGKIYMEDSYIDLGYAEGSVNSFLNNGKLYANGDANYIDMGGNGSVFTNNGSSIHMDDGAANDALTIFGNFAGNGKIIVDANGTSMLADRLYIEGNVVSNTANVIDVYLDQNPSLEDVIAGELIDIVFVSGTSAAANFNLGIVDVDTDSLYTLDYELVKQINYSGTNDLFSLGFEVSGLTPTGVAMSSIAPTVQNLWHLGVGTVFQREGTKRDFHGGGSANSLMNAGFKNATGGNAQVADYQGAAGLWLRAFTEDGGLNPDGGRDNFGLGGAHSFDMKNSGIEFGAGYAFNSQWTAGLLGGVSDGSLKPTIGGRTSIDAKTIGGYVTYTPGNGFYADLSYRSMDFDGDGNGGGQDFSFDGKADGYSLEMGYGFKTSSGLIVEPQFQYSSMDVDLDNVDYNQGGFVLDDGKSSQTRLGVSLRKTMDMGGGNSWAPYASLSYVNESNASNDYIIGGVLTGNVDTSGNSTLLEGGATVKYGNMLFSGGLNWKDGGAYESVFGGQVSVRFTW